MANNNPKINLETKLKMRKVYTCFKLTSCNWYGNFNLVKPLKGIAKFTSQELETRLCQVCLIPLLNPQTKEIKCYVVKCEGNDDYSYSRDFETLLEAESCYNLILAEPLISVDFLETLGFTFSN